MKVYLASGWAEKQKEIMDKVRNCLLGLNLTVFAPYYDAPMRDSGSADEIFKLDISKLNWADFIVVIVDGFTPGAMFEWGYSYARNKLIIVYSDGVDYTKLSPMLSQSCTSFVRGIEQLKEAINVRTI